MHCLHLEYRPIFNNTNICTNHEYTRGGTRLPSECDYLPKYLSLWRLSIDNRHKCAARQLTVQPNATPRIHSHNSDCISKCSKVLGRALVTVAAPLSAPTRCYPADQLLTKCFHVIITFWALPVKVEGGENVQIM